MAIVDKLRTRSGLDAQKDINHWTYRVPGLATWLILIGFISMMVWAPNGALEIARLVGFYALLRIGWTVIFYLVGVTRVLREEHEIAAAQLPTPNVHHIVIIPNYKEPVHVLAKTLEALSQGRCALQQMTVVLAMEAKDDSAEKCAGELVQQFSDRFARMMVTYHPDHLAGEVPGKAANQAWAARQARAELVDRLGLDMNTITVTSCDADSIFHPAYFDELGRLFAAEPHPHNRIWQPPVLFDSNIWKAPATIRLLTYFTNAAQLSELTNPFSFAMPISSYSLSLRLADEVGYWDPVVVSEDYHMYLRCMFARRGNLKLVPIFLPTRGEAVCGENRFQTWKNFYNQQVRHAWGSQDTAFILQQWNRNPGTPFGSKFFRLSKMFFDHNIVAILPVIIFLGTGLAIHLKGEPILTIASNYAFPPVILISNGISVMATIVLWVVEHWRCSRYEENWSPSVIMIELVTWIVMPIVSLILVGIPILHAQTKMLAASPLIYSRTPKGLDYEAN